MLCRDRGSPSKLNLTRRDGASKLPTPEQRQSVNFHSAAVQPIDMTRVFELASEKHERRLRLCFKMLTDPGSFGAVASTDVPRSTFLRKHAEKMCADGNATRVSTSDLAQRPTKNACYAFTVLEQKTAADGSIVDRQRAILAPKRLNDALDRHYQAQLDLKHVSRYIDQVAREAAVIGDLKISFFQAGLVYAYMHTVWKYAYMHIWYGRGP